MRSKEVFTTFEAAKLCHVSPLSIINWVNAGRLSAFRTPGGHRRIRREDLVSFMRENGLPIPDELADAVGNRRVLIVDDDEGIRDSLSIHLKKRSYDVLTAAEGFEAGRLVASWRPQAVLLDLRMPGLDGFQVCRSIKADSKTADTVVIAMTGFFSPETEARIVECGAVRCFAKPFDAETVSHYLDALFEDRPSPRRRGGSARA